MQRYIHICLKYFMIAACLDPMIYLVCHAARASYSFVPEQWRMSMVAVPGAVTWKPRHEAAAVVGGCAVVVVQ